MILLVVAIAKLSSLAKSLQRLSEQIPGTGMTAKELATELGGSIETSFQKFMPQPEKVSSAITASVETALKTASANIENIHKKLLDGQDAVLDKWAAHEKTTTSGLSGISKALEAATQQMSAGLTGGSQKMQSSLDDGAKKLADTLGSLTAKLEASLKDHADKTGQASAQLAAQLEKIAGLQTEVEKLLHLQQATEGTIKSVAASDEFKTLIKALRDHLAASDTFLREAAKPRTIRLVEQEA
ncbi:MAG TPA: hypothetical protein PKE26_14640 [Kiritimatiellia bacterium]|nr:hypothetical protein [Kiritimatiellia bacterium]HMP00338.1 hypothetical protein [Kiritimatiellia bacterium]HMP97213.1 hypothetical protein [Kiritimatiellia bacterium]